MLLLPAGHLATLATRRSTSKHDLTEVIGDAFALARYAATAAAQTGRSKAAYEADTAALEHATGLQEFLKRVIADLDGRSLDLSDVKKALEEAEEALLEARATCRLLRDGGVVAPPPMVT